MAQANRHQNLVIPNKADREKFELFDGRPLRDAWTPATVEIDQEAGSRPASDFPSLLNHVPVFSARALEVLKEILASRGEVLPLNCVACEGGPYFAFNVMTVIDALDLSKSEIKHFSSGRIMRVVRYEFLEDRLGNLPIFKISQLPKSKVFVSDHFVAAIEASKLTGFSFERVWSSLHSVG